MAYTIHSADGTTYSIPDNQYYPRFYNSDTGVGVILIGRNTIDYGQPIAQTLLQMTENFASTTVPSDATSLRGQLWFNNSNGALYVRKNQSTTGGIANWDKIVSVSSSQTGNVVISNPAAGTEKDGDIKVDGSTIYIWAAGGWKQVFPAVYS